MKTMLAFLILALTACAPAISPAATETATPVWGTNIPLVTMNTAAPQLLHHPHSWCVVRYPARCL